MAKNDQYGLPGESRAHGARHVEAIGRSDAFLDFQERLAAAAPVDRPVLLLGERGCGKELAALRLHYLSKRWDRPLVTVNCAAMAESLVEDELFGHEAGAFTGAQRARAGRFEAADGGALFLDEAANIPMPVQEKILRVVEYGAFERLGASHPVSVDVRIIAAANVNLAALAARGKFRRDLLDRLSFEVLFAPPLRERHGDIPFLARHFAGRMAAELELPESPEFTAEAMARLESHAWPGNVRELKNVVERAVFRSRGGRIREIVLDPFVSPYPPPPETAHPGRDAWPDSPAPSRIPAGVLSSRADREDPAPSKTPAFQEAVDRLKKELIGQAMTRARHNQRAAATLLGLTYGQFRGLYRKYAADAGTAVPAKEDA